MKIALISDIHANLEALVEVLQDIERRGYDRIICLGDVVGYGPDPVECTDLIQSRAELTLMGNHDEALIKGAWGFHEVARRAIDWTRKVMRPRWLRPGSRARWDFLAGLPLRHELDDWLLVHGSPRDPTSEYVLPRDVGWLGNGKMQELFELFSSLCFVGHTHVPGVFTKDQFTPQREMADAFRLDEKAIINVGSVGQPRDGDPRACYLGIREERFCFHRVEYPVAETQAKIRSLAELDDRLADRLREGS